MPTGGTITIDGNYTIHTFTSSGTFANNSTINADVLIIGGGGAGGHSYSGGGGGAGGYSYLTSISLASGNHTVTIGDGGVGGTGTSNTNGVNSSIDSYVSDGGGKGGNYDAGAKNGSNGGSGGGGSGGSSTSNGGTATYGNSGGTGGLGGQFNTSGGGGGGAGSAGGNAATSNNGGNGGNGLSCSITGTAITYAGGGGGGNENTNYAPGSGGTGGGGNASEGGAVAGAGTNGLGGGGGGAGNTNSGGSGTIGGNGGSGIVIIRYLTHINVRVSQTYSEILEQGLPVANVSQTYSEVLHKGLPVVRVPQCYIEVLRQKEVFALITQTYVEVLVLPLTVYSISSTSKTSINFTRGVVYYNEINNSLLYPAPSSLNSFNWVTNQGSKVITSVNSILETDVPNLKKRILYDRILVKITASSGNEAAIGTVAYCSINQIDLSNKDALVLYIRASRDTSVGDLALILDNSNTFNSILETLYIPSLVTNTWHRVLLRLNNPYDDIAINTIGIQLLNNLGTFNLDIAEVRSIKELNGFRSFVIENNVDELEESDYQSKGSREHSPSNYFWTATIEGYKEEKPPFIMKTKYVFAFSESNAIGDAFVGDGNYSGFDVVGRMDDLVRYNYKLQGTLPIFFPQKNAIVLQAPEPVL